MSTSSIVRIACGHKGRQQFWTVQQGGALRLGDASQAQLFVCRCEEGANRSCFIQHLQSGAFIEQDETRKLQLALSAASAAVFSKLKAYSEGTMLVPTPSGPSVLLAEVSQMAFRCRSARRSSACGLNACC